MIFLVFTQGLWERVFFFSSLIQYTIDGAIVIFIIFQFKFNRNVPGSKVFLFLCLIFFSVSVLNNSSIIRALFYMRFLLYTYVIYNQLFSVIIPPKTWMKILRFLGLMVLIQGGGAFFNIFILGERIEGYVGLMSSLGGTTATVFPLLISTLVLIYYLFSPKLSTKALIMLSLFLFSGFLVGYSSGKRGIYFIIPIILTVTLIMALPKLKKTGYFNRKISGLALAGSLIFPLMIFGIMNSKGLNYTLSGNESASEVISRSITYADGYENATDQYGNTTGRSNTTLRILENTLSDPLLFFIGYGFGATKEEATLKSLGFVYGIVGFTRDLISGGVFLSLLTIVILGRVIYVNKSIKTDVTTIVRRAILIIFLYIHLFYSSDFTVSIKINLIVIIIMALLNSPVHHMILIDLLKTRKFIKQ
ncbi:hypothetical protein C8N41_1011214 [Winogradskyella sediminis]|nr:hypothetical protein C8N41_1011214 [Winogradskyella sediminis]